MKRIKRLSLIILIFIAVLAVIVGPIAAQGSKIRPFILPFGNCPVPIPDI